MLEAFEIHGIKGSKNFQNEENVENENNTLEDIYIDEFDEQSVPVTFGVTVNDSKIPILKEYLKENKYIKCFFTKESNGDNNIYLLTDELIIKGSFKPEKKDIFIFYIGAIDTKSEYYCYMKSSMFDFSRQERYSRNSNVEKLYNQLVDYLDKDSFDESQEAELNNCFKNIPNESIELNLSEDFCYENNIDKDILLNKNLFLGYKKGTKGVDEEIIIFIGNKYKIKCSTNDDSHLWGISFNQQHSSELILCSINNIFNLTIGRPENRKDNQSLISLYSKFRTQPLITPQITTPKTTYNFKNIILSGVAGIGKTHSYLKLINLIESGVQENKLFEKLIDTKKVDEVVEKERIEFITFHQNYSYEEFIEGFQPNEKSGIKIEDGLFKAFVNKAKKNIDQNYYFVIDEINRGNISKIFGELITLIEDSKRDELEVKLPYSKNSFSIPRNIFIIGTMNITDQSISKLDIALRRRFVFFNIKPNTNLVCQKFKDKFEKLNEYISKNLGDDYLIGHSYFMKCDENSLDYILKHQIEPLLEDYFYGDKESLNSVVNILKI